MVKKVDKNKATTLKEQGKTYAEIAEELGCSVGWCKHNLKDTVKNKEGKEMLQKYIDCSKSKQTITTGQIKRMLTVDFSEQLKSMQEDEVDDFLNAKVTMVKRKIAEAGGHVRPHWMHPEHSRQSMRRMLDLVNDFDSRLYEMLEEFKYDMQDLTGEDIPFLELSAIGTLKMLSQLGTDKCGASKVASICENLTATVEHMEQLHMNQTKVSNEEKNCAKSKYKSMPSTKDFSDLEHLMY